MGSYTAKIMIQMLKNILFEIEYKLNLDEMYPLPAMPFPDFVI